MYNPIQYTNGVVYILYLYCSYQMKKSVWQMIYFLSLFLSTPDSIFAFIQDIVVYFCRGCFNLAFCSFPTEAEVWQIERQNFKVVSNRFFERVFVELNFTELCLLHTKTHTLSQIHINRHRHSCSARDRVKNCAHLSNTREHRGSCIYDTWVRYGLLSLMFRDVCWKCKKRMHGGKGM